MNRFADISALEKREVVNANTRKYIGDGSPFLLITGAVLMSIAAVVVGTTEIPLTETRRYLEDATGRESAPEELKLVDLQTLADGRQVLLRSELSNHGLWQKDTPIFVTGEWAPEGTEPPAPPATEPTPPASEQPNADGDNTPVNPFASLSQELQDKIAAFGSIEKAQEAALDDSNALFKAAGISGNDIQRARAAIKTTIVPEG